MNERIKELYGKASEYACNQLGHTNQHAGKTLAEVANEKFAELIIRECATIAKNEQEFNNRYDQDMVNIDQCILVQFGL